MRGLERLGGGYLGRRQIRKTAGLKISDRAVRSRRAHDAAIADITLVVYSVSRS